MGEFYLHKNDKTSLLNPKWIYYNIECGVLDYLVSHSKLVYTENSAYTEYMNTSCNEILVQNILE